MFILTVRQKFCAAHKLVGYDGDCANMHGHTWTVEVNIKHEVLGGVGMAIDFKFIKRRLKEILPDHKNLNEHYKFNPTAEQIAEYLYHKIKADFSGLESVVVWESENACVKYTKGG